MDNFFESTGQEVAVIGMAGRFPGASDIDAFWKNLCAGKESISFATDEELLALGVDKDLLTDKTYIKVKGGLLKEWDHFDAAFFGYTPAEAELMDPQTRVFLQCAWNAVENAGYNTDNIKENVGVYAGAGSHHNWEIHTFLSAKSKDAGLLATTCLADKDYLCTRVSHKLNLKGPSLALQASCATSLVAIHVACQALIDGECYMALAGGVSIYSQEKVGYLDQNDSYFSSDGHCRAFDAKASGTIGGEGVGTVVLKLLEDAVKDGDHIYAVVKGSAVNNDGVDKANYIAPSVDGQKRVIKQAQAFAQVEPQSVSYIECHGTGTLLGDPIEIEALKQAFAGVKTGAVAIGSVKSNIGHLNGAAGIASFIKTVLALKHRTIPPSINYSAPNPAIDFAHSPFYVNTTLTKWEDPEFPLRAGVSAFGIGGANAHVVLQQAPPATAAAAPARDRQMFAVSAKTPGSLEKYIHSIRKFLETSDAKQLENIAYTLNSGRKSFNHRVCVTGTGREEIMEKLSALGRENFRVLSDDEVNRPVIFMFSGQGSEYINMGLGIYRTEATFRRHLDHCFSLLKKLTGEDFSEILYPPSDSDVHASRINDPLYSGPVKFSFEYALAQLLISWKIIPKAMIGHSLGEYVCACIAGVMELEDALRLVVLRNQLMDRTAEGAMLSVPLPEAGIVKMLGEDISLAAVNTPSNCILSGPPEKIDLLADKLKRIGVDVIRFNVKRAGHSMLMAPILEEFEAAVGKVALKPPQIPFISGTSGTWITKQEAVDPAYWSRHIRHTIRFSKGLQTLLENECAAFIQVGADRGPVVFAENQSGFGEKNMALNMVRHRKNDIADETYLLEFLAGLWREGICLDWREYYLQGVHQRLPLPSYPFDGKKFTLEKTAGGIDSKHINLTTLADDYKKKDILYVPAWRQKELDRDAGISKTGETVLFFLDRSGYCEALAQRAACSGGKVVKICPQGTYEQKTEDTYGIDIQQQAHYRELIEAVNRSHGRIDRIVHGLSLLAEDGARRPERLDLLLDHGFYSLLYLVQALGYCDAANKIRLDVLTNNMLPVMGDELTCPQKATIIGAVNVIMAEYRNIFCRCIDLNASALTANHRSMVLDRLERELPAQVPDTLVAFRGHHRWIRTFEPARIGSKTGADALPSLLKQNGVYVIIGGLGRAGMEIARYLAERVNARIILLQRTPLPEKEQWKDYLDARREDDGMGRKIRDLMAMEAEGGEVCTLAADVSDENQLRGAIETVMDAYGKINGIFHCAMDPGGALIQQRQKESIEAVFASKVRGTMILDRIMRDKQPDFLVLFSSISAILPAAGKIAYCAANAFLDAYAHYKRGEGNPTTIAINWNHWEGTPIDVAPETAEIIQQNSVTRAEGITILQRVLDDPRPQVLVSRQNPEQLAEDIRENSLDHYAGATLQIVPAEDRLESYRKEVAYLAPRTKEEEKIAKIWKTFFGYPDIGIEDDFFQLGGDSLKALHIIPKVNAELGCRISIANFYRYPTVARMTAYIVSGKEYDYRPIFSLSSGATPKKSALICLPYAAGGSSTFMEFAKEMEAINPALDIYAVNYPGNDLDSRNNPSKDIETLVRRCVEFAMQEINTPLAVYGHCVGSYVALDLCARLEQEDIKVNFVAIGGILNHPPINVDEILAADERHLNQIYLKLGTFKGYGEKVPPEAYDRITRNFKADAIEITTHRNKRLKDPAGCRIAAPIVNIISDTDETTPDYRPDYRKWEQYSDKVTLATINGGGHYFINEKARDTARIIDRLMQDYTIDKT